MGKRFTIGALVGIAAGVIAGILTAPKSGRETREDVKRRVSELKQQSEDAAHKAKDSTAKIANEIKSTTEEYIDRGEDMAKKAKKGFFNRRDK